MFKLGIIIDLLHFGSPGGASGSRWENGLWQNQFSLGVAQIHPKIVENYLCFLDFGSPGTKTAEKGLTFCPPGPVFGTPGE